MSLNQRIATITLDEASLKSRSQEAEHERTVAITDLLHENYFAPLQLEGGPYHVQLRLEDQRLIFDIESNDHSKRQKVALSTQGIKRVVRDYFLICESYYAAIKDASPMKLEAIDMGRRGIHNEGSEELKALLSDNIDVDFATSRRLFTLVCVLFLK